QQQRPIGLRYLLPALSLWFVIAAPLVNLVRRPARPWITGVAVSAAAAMCLTAPSLAFTDPLLGAGYRQAADSNLDWGQGFNALPAWSPTHHPYIDYFGSPGLVWSDFRGARDLATAPRDLTGWVAVSVSRLTVYGRASSSWLRAYCPVGVLDRTILI